MLKQGGFQFWNARENEILGLQKTAARSESDCGGIEKNTFKKQRVFQHNRPEADIQRLIRKLGQHYLGYSSADECRTRWLNSPMKLIDLPELVIQQRGLHLIA